MRIEKTYPYLIWLFFLSFLLSPLSIASIPYIVIISCCHIFSLSSSYLFLLPPCSLFDLPKIQPISIITYYIQKIYTEESPLQIRATLSSLRPQHKWPVALLPLPSSSLPFISINRFSGNHPLPRSSLLPSLLPSPPLSLLYLSPRSQNIFCGRASTPHCCSAPKSAKIVIFLYEFCLSINFCKLVFFY